MFFPIYADEQLTERVATAPIATYRRISGTGSRFLHGTITEGETSFEYDFLIGAASSQISADNPGGDFLPSNLEKTATRTPQYFYITSELRFAIYYYTDGEGYTCFDNAYWQRYYNNTWNTIGTTLNSPRRIFELVGLRLGICPEGHASADVGGNLYHVTAGDMLAIDYLYRDIGQTGISTYYVAAGIAPEDKFVDESDTPSYKPTKATVRGGNGSGSYTGSGLSPMGAGQMNTIYNRFMSANGEGLAYYAVSGDAFAEFMAWLYAGGLLKDYAAYRDAVVSCVYVPVSPRQPGGNNNCIYVANRSYTVGTGTAVTIADPVVEDVSKSYMFSGQGYNTYADITDTQISVYLPFYGRVNIDPAAVFQGYLYVRFAIDCRSGNILYNIITHSVEDRYDRVYGSYSGCCGVPIPIAGSAAAGTFLGRATNAVSSIASGAISGAEFAGPVGGIVGAAAGAADSVEGFTRTVIDKAGTVDVNASMMDVLDIRIDIERKIVIVSDRFDTDAGLPSADGALVSTFSGYTEFSVFHADSIPNATDAEKAEIEQYMKEGVFL